MKSTEHFESEATLEEQAAGWIVEREEGFGPGRAEAFARWCESDPRRAEAAARVGGTMALLNELPSVRANLESRIGEAAKREIEAASLSPVTHFNPWPWASGLAALLALCAASWWFAPASTKEPETYIADATAPNRVALTDGSVVDLNANSQLQVRFSAGRRQVDLAAGEAHFQVAHNPNRPFIVTANGVSVRAVGTAFDVRLVGDNVEVLVTEGKVEVDRKAASVLFSRTEAVVPQLSAGERTFVTPNLDSTPLVENVVPAKVHALLSWQDRMTSFVDVPLREMVVRVNRCNATRLVIADPSLAERRIGGVIALDNVDAFVRLLEQGGDIAAERRGSEIILRSAR
jgi:transmembrane sensor